MAVTGRKNDHRKKDTKKDFIKFHNSKIVCDVEMKMNKSTG